MESKKFDEINHNLIDERIPAAYDVALKAMCLAETTIFMAIARCLEEFSDVEMEFEPDNSLCSFFEHWNNDGFISGALSYYEKENGNKALSCRFDLYDIRDSFENIGEELFGNISSDLVNKLDDSDLLPVSSDELVTLETGFQKVNLPRKTSSKNENNN